LPRNKRDFTYLSAFASGEKEKEQKDNKPLLSSSDLSNLSFCSLKPKLELLDIYIE
jgi:hypothetical protein